MTTALIPTPVAGSAEAFINAASSPAGCKQRRHNVAVFRKTFSDLAGWRTAPVATRLAAPVDVRGFAAWSALANQVPIDADYVGAVNTSWGLQAALVHPALVSSFTDTAQRIGFASKETERQWAILSKLVAITGLRPEELHRHRFNTVRDELIDVVRLQHHGQTPKTLTTPLHGLEATLTALGILNSAAPKAGTTDSRREHWSVLTQSAPVLTATMRRYLAQLDLSLRPGSVAVTDTSLRHLADYLVEHHPEVTTAAQIARTHIEGFKAWLVARPGYRGHRQPVKSTIGMRISNLRSFFERIIEWGYPDAPTRNPVFAGGMPIKDRPLPRFLDDPDAAALLAAARKLPEVFDRVCVEVLARTGLARASSSASPSTPSSRSAKVSGCAPRSASSTPIDTYRCTRGSRPSSTSGSSTAVSNPRLDCCSSHVAARFHRPGSTGRCASLRAPPAWDTSPRTNSDTRSRPRPSTAA